MDFPGNGVGDSVMAVWDDKRVKPHVRAAAQEIHDTFGISVIGGFSSAGHIANSDHYTGLALDVMTRNGDPVAAWAINNASRLGVKYVIWNRAIWQASQHRGWERYVGSSPHTDHVHISFYPQTGTEVSNISAAPGSTGPSASAPGCLGALLNIFKPS